MLSKLVTALGVVLISACKPVSEYNPTNNAVEQLKPKCIESQSQCDIKTALANYAIKFSQHLPQGELNSQIKTELPFFIELSVIEHFNGEHLTLKPEDEKLVISAYLEGRDMFMGKVPVFFEIQNEDHVYLARSLLASCSEEQMVWRLWVTVSISGKTESFFVDFTSQRL